MTALLSACLAQASQAEQAEAPFKYSEEWSLVSAPPPAGPYQPVNIDPRVPGPGTVPGLPLAMPRIPAQETPAAGDIEVGAATGEVTAGSAATEAAISADSGAPAGLPPVPGYYQPVMPMAGRGVAAGATSEPLSATLPVAGVEAPSEASPAGLSGPPEQAAVEEPAGEPAWAAEQVQIPAMPETAGMETMERTMETAAGQMIQESVEAPAPDALVTGEQPPMAEPAEAELATAPAEGPSTAVLTEAPNETSETMQPEPPTPPMATGMPPMPSFEQQPATAMQELPYGEPSQPGYYDRMLPPAAGRMTSELPYRTAPGPAEQLRSQPSERFPSGGYYGYGRPAPAPGYGYQAPAYPYQSGRPGGYWNMPSYGYPRMQEDAGDQDIPPPPVYDSSRYPRAPLQGYR